MDIERCREFVVLAQTRNFLEASEQLFISQSSLSKHIKSLEKELGVTLLNRSTRRVELSPEGRVFLPFAERIARINFELEAALFNQGENERSVVNIGSIPVMVPYGITDVLAHFEHENINARIQLFENEAAVLKEMLRKGSVELAFLRSNEESAAADAEEFGTVLFTEDALCAVLPKNHACAGLDRINLGMLANDEFLLLPRGSLMDNLIMEACSEEGFVPDVRYRGSRAENIIDLVGKGMGVSLLMRKPAAYLATDDVRLVDVDPTITTQIKVYYRKNADLSPAAKRLLEFVPLYAQGGKVV